MGRKKKKAQKQIIFCYYCDREFEQEKVLIQHQVCTARHGSRYPWLTMFPPARARNATHTSCLPPLLSLPEMVLDVSMNSQRK